MYWFLTREWEKLSVSVCDCCSIQRRLKQQRRPSQASTDWQVELPGVLVLHVGGGRSSGGGRRLVDRRPGGKIKTQRQQKKKKKREQKRCSQNEKSSQSPRVTTQAELWKWYNTVY